MSIPIEPVPESVTADLSDDVRCLCDEMPVRMCGWLSGSRESGGQRCLLPTERELVADAREPTDHTGRVSEVALSAYMFNWLRTGLQRLVVDETGFALADMLRAAAWRLADKHDQVWRDLLTARRQRTALILALRSALARLDGHEPYEANADLRRLADDMEAVSVDRRPGRREGPA